MNIFLPESTVTDSVRCLDDRRLNKQILEVKLIYDVALENAKGYANHPVVKFYSNQLLFVTLYGLECCKEYRHRFNKEHTYERLFRTMHLVVFAEPDSSCIEYRELYAEGSKGTPQCIRETDPERVHALFKSKLTFKWNNDRIPPKWTNRNPPKWYKEEI